MSTRNKTYFCSSCDKVTGYVTDYVGDKLGLAKFCKECDMRHEDQYKFCILAAGKGTRNTSVRGLHKALLPLENKAIISHIIDTVPNTVKIVIALGYKAEQVRSYVDHVYSNRDIEYVYVDNYDGPGSGPGLSLLMCKEHLQQPFIFTSADTIIDEGFVFDELEENWIGAANIDVKDSVKYCLVKGSKYLDKLYYGTGNRAYIGIAGVYDFKKYWDSLEAHKIIKDEYQVIHGFDGLDKIRLLDFTWHDTGNNESYDKARAHYSKEAVAVKNKEAIFIEGGHVIKYYEKSEKALKRLERVKYLNGCCPSVKMLNDNMYSYPFIPGKLLSNVIEEDGLKEVLRYFGDYFCKEKFEKTDEFLSDCESMYREKTYSRVKPWVGTMIDQITHVNGVKVEPIEEMLDKINWDEIYENAIPSRFHGDFQPENILYNKAYEGEEAFTLIDWRESFGKSIEVGDRYYDLGKLHHALIINGQFMLDKHYYVNESSDNAKVVYHAKSNLLTLLSYFEDYCNNNKLNWQNIELLSIIQYITISSLYPDFHNGEYGRFLFLLGKYKLAKKLK